MSFTPARSDQFPPGAQRTVTTAGAQIVICDATNTPIAANPSGVNKPPDMILVLPPAAGGAFVWKELTGTSNTLTFPAGAAATPVIPIVLPFTIASIEAGSANGFQVTVAWNLDRS